MPDSGDALERSTARRDFEGRVALITGATSGIGAATAKRISELGGNLLLTGRRRAEGERLVREMNRNWGKAVFFAADLRDSREVKAIVPAVLDSFGRLDFAFNNAGISGASGPIVEQSEREYDLVFDINVKAMFLLLQDELRQMVLQGSGDSIVNTSSVGGTFAAPGAAPYVASKHAVLGLTKSAAVEYGRHGIRINAVSPGAIRTELLLKVFGSQEALDRLGSHTRSLESGYRQKLPKLSFGCFLSIRRIYLVSPLSLMAVSARSVQGSYRAERLPLYIADQDRLSRFLKNRTQLHR